MTLGTPSTRPHCVELTTRSLHLGEEEVKKTRKVAQGRCIQLAQTSRSWSLPRDEVGTEQPAQDREEDASNDNQRQGEVGWL